LPYEKLEEIDRWVLAETEKLKERLRKAYADYDFHVIYREMTNYCITILSSFYLDILKDRLYCDAKASNRRLSAQTAMHEILRVIVFYMAPILSFTAEEAYSYMDGDKPSVHAEEFVPLYEHYRDPELVEKWRKLRQLKSVTDKALELARSEKLIGNSLEADVYVEVKNEDIKNVISGVDSRALADICIVSHFITGKPQEYLKLFDDEENGVRVYVTKARGKKCQRCWRYDDSVGNNATNEEICDRCYNVVHPE